MLYIETMEASGFFHSENEKTTLLHLCQQLDT